MAYIDFKKTIWERVKIYGLKEEEIIDKISTYSANDLNDILVNDYGFPWENIEESFEFLEPEDNDNNPTVECYLDDGNLLIDNRIKNN